MDYCQAVPGLVRHDLIINLSKFFSFVPWLSQHKQTPLLHISSLFFTLPFSLLSLLPPSPLSLPPSLSSLPTSSQTPHSCWVYLTARTLERETCSRPHYTGSMASSLDSGPTFASRSATSSAGERVRNFFLPVKCTDLFIGSYMRRRSTMEWPNF